MHEYLLTLQGFSTASADFSRVLALHQTPLLMHTHIMLTVHACVTQDKPLGHSNCLKGKTFVITGTLDSLYRGEAEDYIKRHSGRVTGSVSGKTNFLLVGENSGNSKVNQACGSF